jgi:threonine/homoserine/homoserine lactone efflux protein
MDMLDYSIVHWATFFIAVALLELSPGADMAFMLGQTVRNGRRAGFSALFGSLVATYFHILMAAVGLSAVIAASAFAFSAVKWIGVMYLVWLAIQAFKSSDTSSTSGEEKQMSTKSVFIQGLLICALNPKVAIFFLAFLPQFVFEGAGPVYLQLLLHGKLMVVIGLVLQTPLILLGSRIASRLTANQKLQTWMDRFLGTLYLALGARLAMSKLQ